MGSRCVGHGNFTLHLTSPQSVSLVSETRSAKKREGCGESSLKFSFRRKQIAYLTFPVALSEIKHKQR